VINLELHFQSIFAQQLAFDQDGGASDEDVQLFVSPFYFVCHSEDLEMKIMRALELSLIYIKNEHLVEKIEGQGFDSFSGKEKWCWVVQKRTSFKFLFIAYDVWEKSEKAD
jgi:hypothetical protein